ncbi:MAG: hypothetical protein LBG59_08650 [Candidatus Peribacteria bacterium]|jgi:hypothetical protein|nr:hypothetical protein [Candidatus Peribacteria bacterium]
MGLNIKRKYQLKRFKKVDLLHTDREVKEKGIELITLPKLKDFVGVVQGYQNINFYEVVDFDKPARSMQTGMMPAKLTHTLITIGMTTLRKGCTEEILIFDPFC